MRFWALLFLLGCGDNDRQQVFCGVNNCGDLASSTVAQCLLNAFVRCTPARGVIVLDGEARTYEIGADCSIIASRATSYEVCVGLSYADLDNPAKCPWLIPAGCDPMVSRLP